MLEHLVGESSRVASTGVITCTKNRSAAIEVNQILFDKTPLPNSQTVDHPLNVASVQKSPCLRL
jgi:hypothetical protein